MVSKISQLQINGLELFDLEQNFSKIYYLPIIVFQNNILPLICFASSSAHSHMESMQCYYAEPSSPVELKTIEPVRQVFSTNVIHEFFKSLACEIDYPKWQDDGFCGYRAQCVCDILKHGFNVESVKVFIVSRNLMRWKWHMVAAFPDNKSNDLAVIDGLIPSDEPLILKDYIKRILKPSSIEYKFDLIKVTEPFEFTATDDNVKVFLLPSSYVVAVSRNDEGSCVELSEKDLLSKYSDYSYGLGRIGELGRDYFAKLKRILDAGVLKS